MEVITAISFDSPNTSKPKHQAFPRGILSMTAKLLYRVVAVVLVLFTAGHTFGFLSFRPPSAEGLAVFAAMGNVHFTLDGGSYSYVGFYTGFGLMVSAYMLFSAFLAWHLGAISSTQPQTIVALSCSHPVFRRRFDLFGLGGMVAGEGQSLKIRSSKPPRAVAACWAHRGSGNFVAAREDVE